MDSCIYTKIFNLILQMPLLHIQDKNHKLNRFPLLVKSTFNFPHDTVHVHRSYASFPCTFYM